MERGLFCRTTTFCLVSISLTMKSDSRYLVMAGTCSPSAIYY